MTTHTTRPSRRGAPFSRLLGLTALVALCSGFLLGRAPVASAMVLENGTPLNGIPLNGLPINGTPLNGLPFNGVPLNGTPLNGVLLNRCVLEATNVDHETLPPAPTGRLPWHRLSQTALGQR